MALAQVAEQWTPNRHVLVAMGGQLRVAAQHAGNMQRRILSFVLLGQGCEISRRHLESGSGRTTALAVSAMTDGAVTREHFLTRSRARRLNRNVLNDLCLRWSRLLCHGEDCQDQQSGADPVPFACVHDSSSSCETTNC